MQLKTSPRILKRIGLTLGLGCAFIVMASIFTPERSPAGSDGSVDEQNGGLRTRTSRTASRGHSDAAESSADAHAGLPSLGVIESGRYSIAIFATDVGARYTIVDAHSGEEIGTLLSAEQVKHLLPDIDLKSFDFSSPTDNERLMLAD